MKAVLILAFYSLVGFFVSYVLIDTETLVMEQLMADESQDLPENVILETLESMRYWNRFSMVFTFLLYLLKCFLVALVLYAGLFFADMYKQVRLSALFEIAVYSESILLIGGIIKVMVVSLGDFSYEAFAHYYPMSLLNLFEISDINSLFIYPIQLINAFELGYCLLLAYFAKEELEISFSRSTSIVLSSYGTSLLCWVVLVLFISLNLN